MASGALAGRVALVTGAASGIGRATAARFAAAGAAVALVDRDAAALREAAGEMAACGADVLAIDADLARADGCDRAVEATLARFGRIDVLVNAAGVIRRATVIETTDAEWEALFAVNVTAIARLGRRVVPVMAGQGGGAIINVASVWGLTAGPRAAAYCASKGAVVQLTRAMAIDHAAAGIRVTCLCPGDVDTPMLRREAAELGEPPDRFLAAAADRPLGRVGRPDEIAEAALFLASDAASFVTGAALVVDGGGLAGR